MTFDGNAAQQQLLIKSLCRGLSRLAVAAQGIDGHLDKYLSDLRKLLRRDVADAADLNALIDAIDARIKDVDDERGDHGAALQEVLERMVTQLLGLRPAPEIAAGLKSLRKKVDAAGDESLVPFLLAYAGLQGQALTAAHGNRAGLFARWFGGEPAAAPVVAQNADVPPPQLVREEDDPEPPFSRVSAAVCDVISQLLRQVPPPPQAAENHAAVLQQVAAGLNWYELVPTLENLSFVILAALERDRGDFLEYLLQLNQRLATATQVLQASKEHQVERRHADVALNASVRGNIEAMQQQVAAATSLDHLKSEVTKRLESVVHAMDVHQVAEVTRQRDMEQYLTVLEQRIQQMEQQSTAMEQQMAEQRRLALVDILTQLPNRSAYEERMDYEFDRWTRYQRPLVLAICDVDRFKSINDNFGHLAGDKVLRILARTLRARLRKTDFIARFGGEEFVILMPETGVEDALAALEMVRTAVAECPFHFREQPLKITVSAGLAAFAAGDDPLAVFERADRALYAAKERGRDRCVLASDSVVRIAAG